MKELLNDKFDAVLTCDDLWNTECDKKDTAL